MENKAWNLESFVDALVVELDKTKETLAVKAVNKPLTYTVKDMALDLQIFPSYDGDQVKFVTAQAGQSGASKITIQLASITDNQVRATTKKPQSKDDLDLEKVEIDPETKKSLRKLGVKSVDDLKQIEEKNIDIEKVSEKKIDFKNLANLIEKSRRDAKPPLVKKVSMSMQNNQPILVVEGSNLAVNKNFNPVAVINGTLAEVKSFNSHKLEIEIDKSQLEKGKSDLVITLDPYSLFKINLNKSRI
ncbi:MAG: hypothetical protein K1X55_03285 [Chitinophagales bacterium]|nr:hypothetical protein [Chitinophagales bacterium]